MRTGIFQQTYAKVAIAWFNTFPPTQQHEKKATTGILLDFLACGEYWNMQQLCSPQVCSKRPVEPSWSAAEWSTCSAVTTTSISTTTSQCELGRKSRPIACVVQKQGPNGEWVGSSTEVPASMCSASLSDTIYEDCLIGDCGEYSWDVGKWSLCSTTENCDIGKRTRTLTCLFNNKPTENVNECEIEGIPGFRVEEDCYNASTCSLAISSIVTTGETTSEVITLGEDLTPRYSPFGTLSIIISVQKASILPPPRVILILLNDDFPTFSYYLGNQVLPDDNRVVVNLSDHPVRLRESDHYYILVQSEDYISNRSEYFGFTSSCEAIDCSLNSTCDSVSLVCECNSGYSGDDCSVFSCDKFPCVEGQGQCDVGEALCICINGWTGDACEKQCENTIDESRCGERGYVSTTTPFCSTDCTCRNHWTTHPDDLSINSQTNKQCTECSLECNFDASYDSTCSLCQCKPNSYGHTCGCRYVLVSFRLFDKVNIGKVDDIVDNIVDELAVLGKIDKKFMEVISLTNSKSGNVEVELRFLADVPCSDIDTEKNDTIIQVSSLTDIQRDVKFTESTESTGSTEPTKPTESTLQKSYEALRLIGEAFSKRFVGQDIESLTPTLRANIDFTSELFMEDQLCTAVESCPVSIKPPGIVPIPKPEPEKDSSLSVGAIIGIVIGILVLLIIVVLIIILIQKKKKVGETKGRQDLELATNNQQ